MMKSNFMKIYIIPFIFISPSFVISCNSWFSMWLIMEFNLMSFIPFLFFFNKFNKNTVMKYFFIQTISSSVFLLSSNMMIPTLNFYFSENMNSIIMNASLLMKIGTPPFHSWFISMMKSLSWLNCIILSTWQKIIPMIIIMYNMNYKFIYCIMIMSSFIGSLFGLNYSSLKIIMSFSSINHMGWMLLNMLINKNLWILYFLSYSILSISIMLIFMKFNINWIHQLYYFNKIFKMYLLMNIFSISGLPPMMGFLIKWFTVYYSNSHNLLITIMFMLLMSIFSFFIYTRICLSSMLYFNYKNKMLIYNKFNNSKIFSSKMLFISSFIYLWIISIWLF